MIMEQLMREKLLTVKKEMEGFMKESVPFWLENGIDKEYGGYLVCFDSKGKLMKELAVLTPEDKMIVTQTRMIWGFSALLRNGLAKRYGWEEKCKEAAKQGVDFFIDKFWDKKNTGWAWVTDRKGNVLDNGKLVYGQTFAIYALAEYYMATGDERGIEYAEKTFDALKKYAADTFYGGYFENFKEDWTLESAGVYGGDLKSLDIHMHTMEAYTTLYEATHKNPLDTTSYGHNIELIWLLNRAYEVLGLPPAREFTRKFADYTLANGWDNIHGGIYRDGMHDGRIVVTDKEWWQHFESLTGFLDSYQATEDERYLDTFIKLWEFDKKYFYNPEVGESRQLLLADGTPVIDDTGNQWKCIYHTDRAMMECCLRIESLTE